MARLVRQLIHIQFATERRRFGKGLEIRLEDCLDSIAHGLPPEQREDIRLKQKREIQKTVALLISKKTLCQRPQQNQAKTNTLDGQEGQWT